MENKVYCPVCGTEIESLSYVGYRIVKVNCPNRECRTSLDIFCPDKSKFDEVWERYCEENFG